MLLYRPKNRTHALFLIFIAIITIFGILAVAFRSTVSNAINKLAMSLAQCPVRNETSTILYEHKDFQTWDASGDRLWDDIVPPNGGFAATPDFNDGNPYGFSMIHQVRAQWG